MKIMEDEIQTTSKSSPIIPAIAVLGLGIAIIASAVGGIALTKISRATEDINARIEKNASAELKIKELSDRLDSAVLQLEQLKSNDNKKVENLRKQVQQVVDFLQTKINETRAEVVKNREGIEQLATRTVVATSKKKETKHEKIEEKKTETQDAEQKQIQAGNTKNHKIQAGDTFAKLAKKYNVSVDAILKANPQANPSRLKIGQEIVIP